MLYLTVLLRRGPDWFWFSLVSLEETRSVVGLDRFDGLFYGSKNLSSDLRSPRVSAVHQFCCTRL